jgi:Fe-S-cluster containining protein
MIKSPRPSTRPNRSLRPSPERVSCTDCARCCTYVAVEIEAPERLRPATDVLWFLSRPRVRVYVDGRRQWLVEFRARCSHLGPDRRCRIYTRRSHICRAFDEATCEVNCAGGRTFRTQRQFLGYLEQEHPVLHRRLLRSYGPFHAEPSLLTRGRRG